jgi:hypothetical protein
MMFVVDMGRVRFWAGPGSTRLRSPSPGMAGLGHSVTIPRASRLYVSQGGPVPKP